MDEQEWHAWRAQGVGASDISRAMGAYGWTPARVVDDKLDPAPVTAFQQSLFDSGHAAEGRILDGVQAKFGGVITGQQSAWVHPDRAHCRCTLDGVLVPDGWAPMSAGLVVEAKWTRSANPGWDHFRTQVQYQLAVTGLPGGIIGVEQQGVGGVATVEVEADDVYGHKLLLLADDLWAAIEARRQQRAAP